MQGHKFAFLSRCIVVDASVSATPMSGVILVSHGLIEDIVDIRNVLHIQCEIGRIRAEYVLEDLGDLCVFPGLVDLSVEFNDESPAAVTRVGVMGGVTTVVTHQQVSGRCFTDIAPLGVLTDSWQLDASSEGLFGMKAFLVSQDSQSPAVADLPAALQKAEHAGLPVFLHPEYISERLLAVISPYRALDTAQREHEHVTSFQASDEEETDEVSVRVPVQQTPAIKDEGVMRRTSLKVPTLVKPFDPETEGVEARPAQRKRVSLPSVFSGLSHPTRHFTALSTTELMRFRGAGGKENAQRGSWMSSSSESISEEHSECMAAPELQEAQSDYSKHLQLHPHESEIDAVQTVLRSLCFAPNVQIHITALSSAEALRTLATFESRQGVTVSTAAAFLHFTEAEIKPGDTRYKCNPPIRDAGNCSQLWASLLSGEIGSVTSHHQPHSPGAKFLGSFQKAKNGITSLGVTLSVVWSRLKHLGDAATQLPLLAQRLCTEPAKVAGLAQYKGSLAPGKHADFVVWDPLAVRTIADLPFQYPQMCPFIGEQVLGVVHRTYLRGSLVYSRDKCVAMGMVLDRKKFRV